MKQGWTYKSLGDCIDKVPKQKQVKSKDYQSSGKYPIVSQERDLISGYWDDESFLYKHEKPVIIFGDHTKEIKYIDFDFVVGADGTQILSPKSNLNAKFFYYALLATPIRTLGYARHFKLLKEKSFPVPFLSEQERIVERLDAAFAQIDELKSNAERQLAEARALFQSALTQAMQPKPGWQEIAFKDICSFVRGPFGGSLKKECFKESGYAVYEQQNAIYNKFSFRYFIDEEKYESMKRFSVNPGDLIMSCSGTIGKVAIIPDDAKQGIINQALLKLTPSKKINKYYLKYLMESELFKELIRSYSDGAAIQNIASVSILKEILLRIPSVSEQQRIVEYNDSLTTSFNEIEDNYKQTTAECDALKQALLRQIFE